MTVLAKSLAQSASTSLGQSAAGAGAADPWDQIHDSFSSNSPLWLQYYHADFLTKVGDDVSQWDDAWGLGAAPHPATASVNRPSDDGTYVVFDKSNNEYMVYNFATGEPSEDRTHFAIFKKNAIFGQNCFFSANSGGHLFYINRLAPPEGLHTYDGAFRLYGGKLSASTKYYVVWEHKAGIATASVRVDGVQVGSKLDGINLAVTNTAFLMASGPGSDTADVSLLCYGAAAGVNSADTTALEAVLASLKAALP